MSYVVKNCPAYDYEEEFDYHICKQPLVPYECSVDDCQKCTNCVIKQVIELCKEYDKEQAKWCEPIPFCTDNIYDLFDIKEVNKCS